MNVKNFRSSLKLIFVTKVLFEKLRTHCENMFSVFCFKHLDSRYSGHSSLSLLSWRTLCGDVDDDEDGSVVMLMMMKMAVW